MKKIVCICVFLGMVVSLCSSSANAAISYGTPSPALNPVFGTLINFDDKPTGTPVSLGDYADFGVYIEEILVGEPLFARYAGTQSPPNYIGTGPAIGWDGLIVIYLARPASQIGLGIADSAGGPETLSVFNSEGDLLESHVLTPGTNIYAVITRPTYDISHIEIMGEFFAIDDLQFNVIPAPGAILLGTIGVGIVGWLRRRRTL